MYVQAHFNGCSGRIIYMGGHGKKRDNGTRPLRLNLLQIYLTLGNLLLRGIVFTL